MTEFISRKYGEDGYEVIIKTDDKEQFERTEAFAREMIDHAKPQTNEELLLAMKPEELIDFIARIVNRHGVMIANALGEELTAEEIQKLEEYHRELWAVWAKQPVEEELNED